REDESLNNHSVLDPMFRDTFSLVTDIPEKDVFKAKDYFSGKPVLTNSRVAYLRGTGLGAHSDVWVDGKKLERVLSLETLKSDDYKKAFYCQIDTKLFVIYFEPKDPNKPDTWSGRIRFKRNSGFDVAEFAYKPDDPPPACTLRGYNIDQAANRVFLDVSIAAVARPPDPEMPFWVFE